MKSWIITFQWPSLQAMMIYHKVKLDVMQGAISWGWQIDIDYSNVRKAHSFPKAPWKQRWQRNFSQGCNDSWIAPEDHQKNSWRCRQLLGVHSYWRSFGRDKIFSLHLNLHFGVIYWMSKCKAKFTCRKTYIHPPTDCELQTILQNLIKPVLERRVHMPQGARLWITNDVANSHLQRFATPSVYAAGCWAMNYKRCCKISLNTFCKTECTCRRVLVYDLQTTLQTLI